MRTILWKVWNTVYDVVNAFIEDDALNRGAAIAFYATTALVPILYILVEIAGTLFGPAAARGAVITDLEHLIGWQEAHFLQTALKKAAYTSQGFWGDAFSVIMLLIVASGAFGETRSALNTIWRATPLPDTWAHFFRVRAESLLLVVLLAVLLLSSMLITALLSAFGARAAHALPAAPLLLQVFNFLIMWAVTAILFAAIYKVLPDRDLGWRDVAVGGVVTGLLFQLGQIAIGLYFGSSRTVSIYGAAGNLMALLLWIFYSAEIFLFGAELTKTYTEHRDGKPVEPN